VTGEDGPDRVNRVVTIEALRSKAGGGGDDARQFQRDLGFHGRVNGSVEGQVGHGGIVRLLDERHSLCLVERQPPRRRWGNVRIVAHIDVRVSGYSS
jgi:hypothetical protein